MTRTVLTGLRMMVAGIICYVCYQFFNWPEGYWSVVTISAITQATLSDTMVKALLRLIGTSVGALMGFILASLLLDNIYLLCVAFCLFITFTTYLGLQTKPFNYAPIVAGFTAVIIISSKFLGNIEAVAWYRTLEVFFGIIVYSLINLFVLMARLERSPIFDIQFKVKIRNIYQQINLNRKDLMASFIISIPTTLTFLIWLIWQYPYGFWVTVTLLIIMEDTLTKTRGKSMIRFLGQSLAALYGLVIALFAEGNLFITGAALALGFFFSGWMIGTQSKSASIGNHAGSAIAIMLLVGLKDGVNDIVTIRFLNVFAGILIANLVMLFYSKSRSETTRIKH